MSDLPPGVREWVDAVAHRLELHDALGADRDDVIARILDLTADVAHGVSRPAAPVTAFLVGLAAGRAADPAAALPGRLDEASALAATWAPS